MSFLQTKFVSSFRSELALPQAPPGHSEADVRDLGIRMALKILQDGEALCLLNPILIKVAPLSPGTQGCVDVTKMTEEYPDPGTSETLSAPMADWRQYECTDLLELVFNFKKELIYHTAMRNTVTGIESWTDAGSGVIIHGTWVVAPSADKTDTLILTEDETTWCNWLLSVYIRSTMGKAHDSLHKNFTAKWVEMMRHELAGDSS